MTSKVIPLARKAKHAEKHAPACKHEEAEWMAGVLLPHLRFRTPDGSTPPLEVGLVCPDCGQIKVMPAVWDDVEVEAVAGAEAGVEVTPC